MDLIRCFVAIEIPDELKSKIDDYIFSLKQFAPKIKWIKANNLHITLKFLREVPQNLLQKVQSELSAVSNIVNPFTMSIRGAGFFPNQNKPRVVRLGLQNDKKNSIFKLHEWIDKKLDPLGFEREKRRFSPHLTLGRIKFPDNYHDLSEYINQNEFRSSSFNVSQIVLIKSVLRPTGAEYSQIKTYPFED
jgi:RNA 2',3'-cyclic 3'-phosphodiesterase